MEAEIKEKENDFDDMEKHIVCQSILLETYEKKNQILDENYKELQSEYSGSFDYYKKKIEQLEENNKRQIENTDRFKDIEALEEKHKKHIQDMEENYDLIYEAQKIAHENEIQEMNRCRAQSFTSLMTDLHQDINGAFAFIVGALMEHFLEGSAPLRPW